MDDRKRRLKGSESRDNFKQAHKSLNKRLYALDLDFIWVEKQPPGIVAVLDYKKANDNITFAECIAYNSLMEHFPVYIIEDADGQMISLTIQKYMGGDWRPNPPVVELKIIIEGIGWQEFERWQIELRRLYRLGKDLRAAK